MREGRFRFVASAIGTTLFLVDLAIFGTLPLSENEEDLNVDLMEMVRARLESENDETVPPDPMVVAETLRDALAAYDRKHEFRRGDLVTQKSGLSKYPEEGRPAIYLGSAEPTRDNPDAQGGSDVEMSDCHVGVRGSGGLFAVVGMVSARLEPWIAPEKTD